MISSMDQDHFLLSMLPQKLATVLGRARNKYVTNEKNLNSFLLFWW